MATHATANSYAAQQHFADGRAFQLRDARGAHFEPQTSYIDHYPEKELPVHTPQPAAPVTGVPFTASTEYDNQYLPKSLTFNQIGTYGNPAWMGNSHGHMQKLPTVSSETTNQHFYPYWGVTPPQKKGYAVRRISAAPALDFAGDTFTTTNAVEYQPKPSSYTRPTGVTVAQPLSEACDKHTTYNSFFQAKPTEGFIRVPRGSISSKVAGRAHHSLGCGRVPQIEGTWRVSTDLQLKLGSRNSGGRGSGSKSVV
ncbi:MAG: hypothetical protein FRX49_07876 [Trebouxia sp. A1-2]|nr:MAG: hypothetical protein FRX49_07876 [Trebouxia sp. A1-2]